MAEPLPLELRYHVPSSQAWEGSRGAQTGKTHLHVAMDAGPWGVEIAVVGRINRTPGSSLCGRRGWYERAPEEESERAPEGLCPSCLVVARRAGLPVPGLSSTDEEGST